MGLTLQLRWWFRNFLWKIILPQGGWRQYSSCTSQYNVIAKLQICQSSSVQLLIVVGWLVGLLVGYNAWLTLKKRTIWGLSEDFWKASKYLQRLFKDFLSTIWGRIEDFFWKFLRTFWGLFEEFLRTLFGLYTYFLKAFEWLSRYIYKTFLRLLWTFWGLS